jgi:HlyD family secretion protein
MQAIWQGLQQHKRGIAVLLLLVLTAAGGAVYYKRSAAPVVGFNTTVVVRGDIRSVVSATGTIKAVNSVEISSRVTGLITKVTVKENDMVRAGQVLVVLDDTSLKEQVAQYQAQLTNYAAIYERSRKLAAIGGQSVQEFDLARTNYLVAQSTYNNFVSQLGYYVITSPLDGIVVGTPTPAGQTVAQGISSPQVIMTIADMSKMQIKVLVDETDIGKVKEGQAVSFTVDSYSDKTFTGKVTGISRSATTSSNVVYYPVYVDVESPQGLLFPTMTARVGIHVGESRNAIIAPSFTVKEEKGQKFVQVLVNGKEQSRPVDTGLTDDENSEILSGLSVGDLVVLPADKPGTAAEIQNQEPPPPI